MRRDCRPDYRRWYKADDIGSGDIGQRSIDFAMAKKGISGEAEVLTLSRHDVYGIVQEKRAISLVGSVMKTRACGWCRIRTGSVPM